LAELVHTKFNGHVEGDAFFGKAFGGLEDDPVAIEYAHMIDFTFLNYALRETMGLFLKFLALLTPILSGDLHSIVVASDKVDEVSSFLNVLTSLTFPSMPTKL
jgi:hypothetical protein